MEWWIAYHRTSVCSCKELYDVAKQRKCVKIKNVFCRCMKLLLMYGKVEYFSNKLCDQPERGWWIIKPCKQQFNWMKVFLLSKHDNVLTQNGNIQAHENEQIHWITDDIQIHVLIENATSKFNLFRLWYWCLFHFRAIHEGLLTRN